MPEVIEVDFLREEVSNLLKGKEICEVSLKKASLSNMSEVNFSDILKGKHITGARRKGKVLIIDLSGGFSILIHFLLTGFMRIYKEYPNDIQVSIRFCDDICLGIGGIMMGGFIKVVPSESIFTEEGVKELGIDVLDPCFTAEKFAQIVRLNRNKRIKAVLMDQHIIAGLGNAYSDEILFQARVRPDRKCSTLRDEEILAIYKSIGKVFEESRSYGGESELSFVHLDGRRGEFHEHFKVHKQENKDCPECGGKIVVMKIGGRGSYFCPNCQK